MIRLTRSPLAIALVLCLAGSPLQAAAQGGTEATLQRYLQAPQMELALVAQMQRDAILSGAGSTALLARLQQAIERDPGSRTAARAWIALGALQWQQGDVAAATQAFDAALVITPDAEGLRLRAALADATGDLASARIWYPRAIAAAQVDARWPLQVRAALLQEDVGAALDTLAREQPGRRAALAQIAAMRGDAAAALALGSATPARADVATALRLAQWALDAGQDAQARTHAWAAYDAATDAGDQRYALALWMEAWRNAGQMDQAVASLRALPAQPELRHALVDALLEQQQFDAAIALVRDSTDPTLRQRLLGILELAGRRDAQAAEYQRLIQAQPGEAGWYAGLAALKMADGDEAGAQAQFERLFARNPGRWPVLLTAARQMSAMGMQARALELLRAAGGDASTRATVALFEFDALMARGDDSSAMAVLEQLRARLPAGDAMQVEIADGFERLQQPQQALQVLSSMERARGQALDYDLQVRMANLAASTGDQRQALQRWQALWEQAKLPARRAFLERQIVKTARALGELETQAALLEQRQASAALQPAQLDLLVALCMALDAPERAEAAVARHVRASGGGRVVELQQLGGLYARLGDSERVDDTLQELARLDPDNAGIYLRRLALNAVKHPPVDAQGDPLDEATRLAQLQDLLARLQKAEGRTADDDIQYAAGLYAMAGLDTAATAGYERAAAMAPDDLDTLLQLADLYKRQQRVGTAVAMLQAAAASTTDQRRFVQLVDAISGSLAIAPDERVRRGDVRTAMAPMVNAWVQRQLLARLATDKEDYPLYAVLADIGQSQADFALQLRAYENSLAAAGEQRGLVLRQLVTLVSGGNNGDGQAGAAIGDNARKVTYGRRLLALKREFPPDFFADLGRALLASGDPLGAERAFASMSDIGGLVNVAQVKGDTYARQGFVDQALMNYSQALARDQDNLDLTLKTSILLERQGEDARANRWYWHGLRGLLLRQPLLDSGLVNDAALDAQRFVPALQEGLLLTWHDEDAACMARWQELQAAFQQALRQSDPTAPLARHTRLLALLGLQQRLGEYRGDGAGVQQAEDAVLAMFQQDTQAPGMIEAVRVRTGRAAPLPATQDWVMQGLARQAAGAQPGKGNATLALALAASSGDDAQVRGLMADALKAEADWQALDAREPQADAGPNTLYVLLVQGLERLSREQFVSLMYAPLDAAPFRDAVLFNLYRGAPDRYAAMEQHVGRPLLQDDTVMRLLVEQGNKPMPYLAIRRERGGDGINDQIARFSPTQRLELLERFDAAAGAGRGRSILQTVLLQDLLRQPLDAGQRTRVSAVMTGLIDRPLDFERGSAASALQSVMIMDPDRGNQPLLLDAARRVARRDTDGAHLPTFLQAWFDGDRAQALQELQALQQDLGNAAGNFSGAIIAKYFPEQRQQRIAAFMEAAAPDATAAAAFYREFVADPGYGPDAPDQATLRAYTEKLVAADPANAVYVATLLDLLSQQDDDAAFLARLQAFVDENPGNRAAAATLGMTLAVQGDSVALAQLKTTTGMDIEDVPAMVALVNTASAPRQDAYAPDFNRLLMQAYYTYQGRRPDAPLSKAVAAQRTLAHEGEIGGRNLGPLLKARAEDPAHLGSVLRGMWRNAAPGERQNLLHTEFDEDGVIRTGRRTEGTEGTEQPDMLAQLAAEPAVSREFDLYLRALPTAARQREQRLYDLVADGAQARGQAGEQIRTLGTQLADGAIDGHGLQLWATLVAHTGTPVDAATLDALRTQLLRRPVLSPRQRGLYAQVFALAGDTQTAEQLVRAATLQWLQPDAAGSDDYDLWNRARNGLDDLAALLGTWPDRAAARRAWKDLRDTVEPERERPELMLKRFDPPAWLGSADR